ncbi:MAG: trypsin-like peptidase domain-containing protein [Halobacteriovoraceae bacterium]|nr:trypsin-like peptidase domain-containing protein [Halobacteriovoraceae bacterium]
MKKYFLFLLSLVFLSTLAWANSIDPSSNDLNNLTDSEKSNINVFNTTVKSVVNISSIRTVRDFWNMRYHEIPAGTGSGYVWDNQGHIVTNAHVVDQGEDFFVTFHGDKKRYQAKLVGLIREKDIAVIKLLDRPGQLIPLNMASSKNLKVGQKAIAIGSPFGLDHTMTVGIVSALGRTLRGYGNVQITGMIQTDASINPGNSGGPLINSNGKLIGMNTMIFSNSGSSAGVGFAVPVDTIASIVPQLIKNGRVERPIIGVQLLPDHIRDQFKIKEGVVITEVFDNTPAGKAGLKGFSKDKSGRWVLGDIILKVDKKAVNNYEDIYSILGDYQVGDTVKITYQRGNKVLSEEIKLISANKQLEQN